MVRRDVNLKCFGGKKEIASKAEPANNFISPSGRLSRIIEELPPMNSFGNILNSCERLLPRFGARESRVATGESNGEVLPRRMTSEVTRKPREEQALLAFPKIYQW